MVLRALEPDPQAADKERKRLGLEISKSMPSSTHSNKASPTSKATPSSLSKGFIHWGLSMKIYEQGSKAVSFQTMTGFFFLILFFYF